MDKKLILKTIWEKIPKFFSNLGKVTMLVIAMGAGFGASEVYHYFQQNNKASSMQKIRVLKETSAAINERGELMLIDRKTGTFIVYEDSVARVVFDLVAGNIVSRQNPIPVQTQK
jgi:hypothetical protein